MAAAGHVCESLGEFDALARLLGGLIGVTEKPKHYRPVALAAYRWIMPAINEGMRSVLLAIVELEALEHMLTAADVLCIRHIGRPAGMVRFQQKSPIAKPFRHPEQLARELATGRSSTARPRNQP